MPVHARMLRLATLSMAVALAVSWMSAAPAAAASNGGDTTAQRQTALRATSSSRPRTHARVQRALAIARAQQGDPYRYGAAGPDAFDCSGLMFYATHRAGFRNVPRTSRAQASFMRRISKSAMRPGDFVFFTGGGGVYHVGMYVGRNRVLHAANSGTRVRVDRIWTGSWFGGTLRGR